MITLTQSSINLLAVTKGGNVFVQYNNEPYLMKGKTFNKINNGVAVEAVTSHIEIGDKQVQCFKTLTF